MKEITQYKATLTFNVTISTISNCEKIRRQILMTKIYRAKKRLEKPIGIKIDSWNWGLPERVREEDSK